MMPALSTWLPLRLARSLLAWMGHTAFLPGLPLGMPPLSPCQSILQRISPVLSMVSLAPATVLFPMRSPQQCQHQSLLQLLIRLRLLPLLTLQSLLLLGWLLPLVLLLCRVITAQSQSRQRAS